MHTEPEKREPEVYRRREQASSVSFHIDRSMILKSKNPSHEIETEKNHFPRSDLPSSTERRMDGRVPMRVLYSWNCAVAVRTLAASASYIRSSK